MLNHLRSVHDIHVDHQERPLSGRMDAFVKVKERRPPCSATTQSTTNDLIVDWCVLDLRPLDIVNDRGLERLLDFFCPGYELPSRTHITTLVKKRHAAAKKELTDVLQEEAQFLSLTTDGWTSKATQSYSMTTGHFIDKTWSFRTDEVFPVEALPTPSFGTAPLKPLENSLKSPSKTLEI